MRIFPPALAIDEAEGFTPDKDLFKRADLGKGLTHFLGTVSDPMVVALDAQWGSGKTTFLKMWAGELRKSGFPVIYFDAFENDYFDDAFLAIAGEIFALVESRRQTETTKAQEFLDKAKKVSKALALSGGKVAIKALTLGVVNAADFSEASEEIAKSVSEEAEALYEKHISDMLTHHGEQKDSIQKFREALSELPSLLATPAEDGGMVERPLVFIIDELDRCKPFFALQLLERIKHFFAVKNVHFVLGTHLAQLQNSVVAAYGGNIDAPVYLQKFIHLIVPLSRDVRNTNDIESSKYIDFLAMQMALTGEGVDPILEAIKFIALRRSMSLRSIERIMTCVAIGLAFSSLRAVRPPHIFAGLCVLKALHPDLFVKAQLGTLMWADVLQPLLLNEGNLPGFSFNHERFKEWWAYCLSPNPTQEMLKEFGRILANYNVERERIVPIVASTSVGRLQPLVQTTRPV